MNYAGLVRMGLAGMAALGITLLLLTAGPLMEKKISAPGDLQSAPVRITPPRVPPEKRTTRPTPPEPEKAPTLKPLRKPVVKQIAPPVSPPSIQTFAPSDLPPIAMPPRPKVQSPPHRAALTQKAAPKTASFDGILNMGQVDEMPRVIRYQPPVYPLAARGRSIEGRVVIRCIVSAAGQVDEAEVRSATPSGVFEKSALNAVRKWRFAPARLQGRAVAVYVDIPLVFALE